ncbi:MAG: PDZ domain-containing protein [Candidatus Zhuqueibacterota bacterium]
MLPRRNTFKKFPSIALSLYLTLTCIFVLGWKDASAQSAISYYIEIDEEHWNSFFVALTIQNNVADQFLCQIPRWSPVSPTACEYHTNIFDFEAKGDMGQSLEVTKLNSHSWLVECQKSTVVIISYKIKASSNNLSGIKLDRSFASVNCAATFMSIRELMMQPVQLVVRVPHGWKLATGLPTTESFEYFAQDYNQLANNILYMAPFFNTDFSYKNRNFFLIVDGPRNFKVNKLLTIIQRLIKESYQIFGELPFDQYMFIFKNRENQFTITSQSFSNCSVIYVPSRVSKDDLIQLSQEISSSLYKTWNGSKFAPQSYLQKNYQLIPRSTNLWVILGLNDYLGLLSLIRAGIIEKEYFIQYQIRQINDILRQRNFHDNSITDLSYNISDYDYSEVAEILKLKGHVLGFLLDVYIRSNTENTRSLVDVLQFLNSWFGQQSEGYSDTQILQAINSVTALNLTSFFDKYINGTLPFPSKEIFAKAGIFIESVQDTLPDFGPISISENDNRVLEVPEASPLAFAGLKVGDKLLSINDLKLQHPIQFDRFVDSLHVGQETDLNVQRQGLMLMLSAKVAGKICQVYKLIDAIPKNELQIQIQNSMFFTETAEKKVNATDTLPKQKE